MPDLSLAHVCIKTTSLEKTASFYCDALNLKKCFDFMRNGSLAGFYLEGSNGTFIEVFLADGTENTNLRTLNHFCLETSDIRGLRQRFVDHGYQPVGGRFKMHHFGSNQSAPLWTRCFSNWV